MINVQEHIDFHNSLKKNRSTWETMWQEIAELMFPNRSDFTSSTLTKGEKKNIKIFDSTATTANELLAAGFHGLLTNLASVWFYLRVRDARLNELHSVKKYLQEVSEIMNAEIAAPSSGFSTAMHEDYMEYGGFGTSILFVGENRDRDGIQCYSRPLSECVIAENSEEVVDTVYRQFPYSIKNIFERWPKTCSEKVKKAYRANEKVGDLEIIHGVFPRKTRKPGSKLSVDLPYAEVYIEKETKTLLFEGGYHEFPYLVSRFYRSAGELYGRGPGTTSLPDVKLLQKAMETIIRLAQKKTDPPLSVPDEGYVGPITTVPGGLNFRKASSSMFGIDPIGQYGDYAVGMDFVNDLRNRIKEKFFVEQLQLHVGPQMTATEVMQRTEERLRLLGPVMGRKTKEKLGPFIDRVYNILDRQGKFPVPPPELEGQVLEVEYVSPMAKAQKQLQAGNIARALELIGPLSEMDQRVRHVLNGEATARVIVDSFSIPYTILRDAKEVEILVRQEEEKIQRAMQMQQAEQGANIAKNAGSAVKGMTQ